MSFITDEFIAAFRKNILAVFDMIRKLSAHQSEQDKRIERLELTLYGLSEEFKIGANGKT